MRAAIAALFLASTAAAQPIAPWGDGQSRGEDLVVSLVTFGLGDEIISWFGHTALVVEDRRLHQARLYNYGMFSFDDKMLLKFAMGRLEFWVGEAAVGPTFEFYKSDNRDVWVQELNLLPEERVLIAQALAQNVLPKNRDYLYAHYSDNCATRPRDMIDRAIRGQLKKANQVPGRMSLRDHTRRHSAVLPPMSLLLDFLMNDEIDKPITQWDEAFLPAELMHQVGAASFVNAAGQTVPLVARNLTYYKSTRPPIPDRPPAYGPWLLFLGVALGGGGFALSRVRRRLFAVYAALIGLVIGLPGTALAIMWAITNHTVTWHNENLLLSNPLTLATVPLSLMLAFGSKRGGKALRLLWTVLAATGLVAILIHAIPSFDQDNWRLIALILPINLGFAAALSPRLAGSGSLLPIAAP